MTIKLYNNKSRANKITKVIEDEAIFTGEFIEDTSIEGPSFCLNVSDATILTNYNYAYIVDFNKYYFIINKTIEEGNIVRLSLAIDVLMTYKTELASCYATISRSSQMWNLYLQDQSRQTQQNNNTYVLEWPNGFNNYTYVLTTLGSAQNI